MAKRTLEAKITADNRQFKSKIDESKKSVGGFSDTVKKAGMALLAAFAAQKVVSGLKEMIVGIGNTADRLLDLEQITGLSTDRLQEYEHVARVAGVQSEAMARAVEGLTQRLARGAEMSVGLRMGVERLGISVFNSAGNLRDLGNVTEEAISKLADMEDVTQRNVIGAQLFSGAWKDIAPILALGTDGIEKAKNEAHKLGLVMDKEALEAANQLRIEMETLNAQFAATKRDITIAALPALLELTARLQGLATIIKSDAMPWYQKFWAFVSGNPISIFTADSLKSWEDGLSEVDKLGNEIIQKQIELNKLYETYEKHHKPVVDAERELAEMREEYNKLVIEGIRKEAEEAKAAAEEAKKIAAAEADAAKKAEEDRIAALGTIGKLQEDIKIAEAQMITANTNAEAQRWAARKTQLEEELRLVQEVANAGITPIDAVGVTTAEPEPLDLDQRASEFENYADVLVEQMERIESAGKGMSESTKGAIESTVESMALMAASGRSSASDIIKQAIAMSVAHLIKSIMSDPLMPLPAKIALALGAGALAGQINNAIPSYAMGTSSHGGGLAMVGERGPELVSMPAGSRVFPNNISRQKADGELTVRGKMYGGDVYFTNERFSRRKNLIE